MASAADVSYSDVFIGSWKDSQETSSKAPTSPSLREMALSSSLSWPCSCSSLVSISGESPPSSGTNSVCPDMSIRNNGSPGQTLWNLTRIAWAWRHAKGVGREKKCWWRVSAVPILVPLLFLLLLTATGVLSSDIMETSQVDVLLRGDECGIWEVPNAETVKASDNTFMIENAKYIGSITEFGRIYARACYNTTSQSNSPMCEAFTREAISYSSQLNASCPFDPETCIYRTGNLQMDTGNIDTNTALGINTRKDNVHFRKVTTCAPLQADLWTTRENTTGPMGEGEYRILWNWGTIPWYNDTDYVAKADSESNNRLSKGFTGYSMVTQRYYRLDERLPFPSSSSFIPRQEFNTTDGDIYFLFLAAQSVNFAKPIDDPWFSAHRPSPGPRNRTYYFSDHLLSPLGCVEQFQYCNPHKDACTPLAGIVPATAAAKFDLDLSPMQSAIVDLLINAVYANNAIILQPVNMLADDTSNDGVQMPLPNNQWVIELQDMHNRVLTQIQRAIVDYARGPSSPAAKQFLVVPDNNYRNLCSMIRARTSGRFASINTYGLALTIGLGTLVILANVFLESLVRCFQRRRKAQHTGVDTWVEDGLLQVHKRTLVLGEDEDWQNTDGAVPVTRYWDSSGRERGMEERGKEDGVECMEEHKRVSIRVEDVDAVRRADTESTLAVEEEQGSAKHADEVARGT
ncbi:hypothetical protein BU23DRAFT_630648 [Bimuria novae-zelandiae CBS 107.79]|uniref:Uncharacterized protein n=1 Tax=Bimuria novae-zelandiae CBS 107.79 TaxID=1447943 RepID=A0A6A5UIB2_9PLEO|nr:hypothetical protein BU23DRAFT_630648 [Bimuria novae-zelandiae CBS 107.79]